MKKRIDFKTYSSIRIGPTLDVELIDTVDSYENYYILGKANNVIVSDAPPPLCVLSKAFDYIRHEDGYLTIGAATPSGKVLSFCKKQNIRGFEILDKLPGSLGGLIKMNAGLKGDEIGEYLVSIQTAKGIISKELLGLGYRTSNIDSIIFEATFKVEKGFESPKLEVYRKMRENQPQDPSAGSCFKNPEGDYAGRLIESVGLKGYKIGDAAFSEIHANFLVNQGNATYEDAKSLMELAKKRVFEASGITLQNEVLFLEA